MQMRTITLISNLKNDRYDEALDNNQGFALAYTFWMERECNCYRI